MKPQNQLNLIGHDDVLNEFKELYDNDILPKKILISGKKGIGKSTLAYHLINYIFSKNEQNRYHTDLNKININNNSYKLVQKSTHPNLFKINLHSDKKFIDVSQIREMINFTQMSTFDNKEKIILIDEAEHLNLSSTNALLKILEEKNLNTIFILVFNNEKKILKTIKSRCIEFKVNLKNKFFSDIVNNYFKKDIFKNINSDFKIHYFTPGFYIDFINLCDEFDFNYTDRNINDFFNFIISEKIYNKKLNTKYDFKIFLELYFNKRIKKIYNKEVLNYFAYFNRKYYEISKYNLDLESFFIEFNSKILNE